MRVISSAEELMAAGGTELGTGAWYQITQPLITGFANLTDDMQWIHDDPQRAAAGPFGATIAHGFLTLSLIPRLSRETFRIDGARMSINYGLDRVRFPRPVLVNSYVRTRATLSTVVARDAGLQATIDYVVELRDADGPACVARSVRLVVY